MRKVAEYLGWPLVVLDPSVFAQEGLPLIATVASRVFSQLLELEDTVIFFDEMEALMYTRSDAGGSFEQKFLTTSLQAEQILSHFRAELMDDEEFREEMVGTALG